MQKGPRKVSRVVSSEDALAGIDAVSIRLEDGTVATFRVADEVAIPETTVGLRKAARKAAARVAFWSYQTARALHKVRKQEARVNRLSGEKHLVFRAYYGRKATEATEQTGFPANSFGIADNAVKADEEMTAEITKLNKLRQDYDIIKAISGATVHRAFLIGTLLKPTAEAMLG